MKEETPESTEWKRSLIAEQFPKLFVIYKGCNDPFGYYRKDAAGYTTIEHAWQVSEEVGLKEVCGRDTDPDRVRLKPAPIPDYFRDLNACREMEQAMTDEQYRKWSETHLLDAICNDLPITQKGGLKMPAKMARWYSATAAQRAEAFGLTLGLWKPGQTEI